AAYNALRRRPRAILRRGGPRRHPPVPRYGSELSRNLPADETRPAKAPRGEYWSKRTAFPVPGNWTARRAPACADRLPARSRSRYVWVRPTLRSRTEETE